MKKLVIITFSLFGCVAIFAQNYKQEGDAMAAAGNYSGAATMYELCMEQDEDCLLSLFNLVYDGKIELQSMNQYYKLIRPLADNGNATAQFELGTMYYYGEGVTKDDAEAVKWYRKAAEQGHAGGQSNLGFIYENGYGVTKNVEEALEWYRKAAEQDDEEAIEALKRLKKPSPTTDRELTSADFEKLRQAISTNHKRTANNNIYKGQYPNGIAAYILSSGSIYVGGFRANQMSGDGILIFADGYDRIHVGNWSNNNMSKGAYYDATGKLIYQGELNYGKPQGSYPTPSDKTTYKFEVLYLSNQIYIGETTDGNMDGYGIWLLSNGDILLSWSKNGIPDGEGINIQNNGTVNNFIWKQEDGTQSEKPPVSEKSVVNPDAPKGQEEKDIKNLFGINFGYTLPLSSDDAYNNVLSGDFGIRYTRNISKNFGIDIINPLCSLSSWK